ncbi:hypothetical protein G7046_g584 [Stylonectria norvegica]|nr:hypothetical protein G7046_g584 [Stylonectria norvegica]
MPTPSSQDIRNVMDEPKYLVVLLPDLFQSFLKEQPIINPNYERIKLESEQWISKFCSFPPKMAANVHKCDFSYFCAIAAPDAPAQEFRTLCDWGNWVFPYDDMFDNGELRDQPEQSQRVMQSLMASMLGPLGKQDHENKLRIVEVHDTVVLRVSLKSSPGVQNRFAQAMHAYATGALAHVDDQSADRTPSLEEMIVTRRTSAGVSPIYHLVEYAHGLIVPDYVFQDTVIQELESLGMDMVSITNDMLSYRKEEAESVPHNMVAVCRMRGMSAQEAFNTVGGCLQERYRRWDVLETTVPSWGTQVDKEVRAYIRGIKCVVQANLNWSFKSERYLGRSAGEVKRTRMLKVEANPPYLTQARPYLDEVLCRH